jgi:hypothetical protein
LAWANQRFPGLSVSILWRYARYLRPARIGVGIPILRVGLEDADWCHVSQKPQLVGGRLHLEGAGRQEGTSGEQVGKDGHLGTKHCGFEWGYDEIDGTPCIVISKGDVATGKGGEENDRRHLRLLTLTDEAGGLEPVHGGHTDVKQNDGELLVNEAPQGSDPRVGLNHGQFKRRQRRHDGESLVGVVIDDQHMRGF